MLNFISSQLLFYFAIALVLFVPGYFFLLAIESKKKLFSSIERFVFSFGLSIIIIDLLMMLMGKVGILFNRISVIFAILLFSAICFAIHKMIRHNTYGRPTISVIEEKNIDSAFNFSKNQIILIILLLFLTIFIKTAYLKNSIFPTSTDLGHHMYWTKIIAQSEKLPVYAESDIIQIDGNYQISQPKKIADFIIGEHLPFVAIQIISRASFVSYFPILILFLINIAGILAIFITTLRLFENHSFGKNAGIISLFLIGPLYAISSSQAKFVSGGVIGNIIGNLLIPMAVYFLLRAFKEKDSTFLSLSILSVLGMAYTHHLTTLIFIFIFIFTAIIFSILNYSEISFHFKEWMKIISKPQIVILAIISLLFVFTIYMPTYFNAKTVGTAVAVDGPSKETRAGLTFNQLKMTAGEVRMVLGLVGIFILLALKKRKNYENAFVLGWCISIIVMSLWPQILFLNLPSTRIANYISLPLTISGAFAIAYIIDKLKSADGKFYLNPKMFYALCSLLSVFALTNGYYDNSQSLKTQSNYQKSIQTIHASDYLGKNIQSKDLVVKDHNYISTDSWMKLSFMNGYNYPFSRGYFKRYEDITKPREMCTLWMISTPNTSEGQKCFSNLGVNFIMVNPRFDSAQFQKSNDFWQVYSGKEINIYYRNK